MPTYHFGYFITHIKVTDTAIEPKPRTVSAWDIPHGTVFRGRISVEDLYIAIKPHRGTITIYPLNDLGGLEAGHTWSQNVEVSDYSPVNSVEIIVR